MSDHHQEYIDRHNEIEPEHELLSVRASLYVFAALLVGTVITIAAAYVDTGSYMVNFVIAMLIATAKASLVVVYFMGMNHEVRVNKVFALSSLVFLAIFFTLTAFDMFYRGPEDQNYWALHKGEQPFPELAGLGKATKSQFEKPWEPNPDLIKIGQQAYATSCASCHGASGMGDGPGGASMNPKPRNFHTATGWTKPRKPSNIYETIEKGIPGTGMSSFAALPIDEKWGLVHYILTMAPGAEADTPSDLARVGIDPTKPGGGLSSEKKEIPVDLAIEIIAVDGKI